jgi:hypothetical protein
MLLSRTKGQSLVEFAMTITLVAIVGVAGVMFLGSAIQAELAKLVSPDNTGASGSSVQISSLPPGMSSSGSFSGSPLVETPTTGDSTISDTSLNLDSISPPQTTTQTTQTSGSNGDINTLYANMDSILSFGNSISTSNSTVGNSIVQLGNDGKNLAQAMLQCEQDPSCDGPTASSATSVQMALNAFQTTYNNDVKGLLNDGAYAALSQADQQTLDQITADSLSLADALLQQLWPSGGYSITMNSNGTMSVTQNTNTSTPSSGSQQVDANSNQTIQCGTDGQC